MIPASVQFALKSRRKKSRRNVVSVIVIAIDEEALVVVEVIVVAVQERRDAARIPNRVRRSDLEVHMVPVRLETQSTIRPGRDEPVEEFWTRAWFSQDELLRLE